jgi:hypothetical protein
MSIEKITINPEPLRPATAGGVPAIASNIPENKGFSQALAEESAPYSRMLKRGESASRQSPQTMAADNDFSFFDFLDIINPLQHIPVVSTLYREITGDTIKPGLQMAGGVMFGGVVGAIASLVNGVVQTETGRDIGGNIMLALRGEPDAAPQVAKAQTPKETYEKIASLPMMPGMGAPVEKPPITAEDSALLSLYGPAASAHASYKQANMRSYLNDVTRSERI